jgi:hypothetical protein
MRKYFPAWSRIAYLGFPMDFFLGISWSRLDSTSQEH